LIVIDEAAYISTALFFETILPLLEVKKTALLAISTPLENQNYYSKLLTLSDPETGDTFFNVIRVGMVCDECKKLEYIEMIKCNHNVKEIPPWKSTKRHDRYARLYEGQEALGLRENAGIITDDGIPAFDPDDVNRMFTLEPFTIYSKPDFMFLVADQCAAGPSKTALMSGFRYEGTTVVVSLFMLFGLMHFSLLHLLVSMRKRSAPFL